jgi:thiamine biosynthesis lipoprotein
MTADALTKVLSVLGPQAGMKLIEATPQAAARLIRAPNGALERYQSSRWKDLPTVQVGNKVSSRGTRAAGR